MLHGTQTFSTVLKTVHQLFSVMRQTNPRPPILFLQGKGKFQPRTGLGARLEWVVRATPRPPYPRERPGIHCIEGWVVPRPSLDSISVTSILISSPLRLGLSCGLPHRNTVCISHLPHTYHVPGLYRVFHDFRA